ncbi:hypothetical protein [Streptomyces endophytica]|uniref:Thioredoxin n=1 Tax=Streptomyces endophytica TaxID=2991496 RepID=A0ABY6PGA0_9ACTN|nr:hypothetical protein [Streptomyces endophytica]UZJ32908.1 hypothetical protein OJ254_24720 [Streptomyces endophytica]
MSAPTDRQAPHAPTPSAEEAGRRVEEVLDRLTKNGDPETGAAAEELVRVLMDFYGAGLARVMHHLERTPDGTGPHPALRAALLGDPLVTSLLALHDLHPEDTEARIGRALDSVRGRHPAETAGFDPDTGTLRLRAAGSGGCGCSGEDGAGRQTVEAAVSSFAPEVTTVEWAEEPAAAEPVLLQISRRPSAPATAS